MMSDVRRRKTIGRFIGLPSLSIEDPNTSILSERHLEDKSSVKLSQKHPLISLEILNCNSSRGLPLNYSLTPLDQSIKQRKHVDLENTSMNLVKGIKRQSLVSSQLQSLRAPLLQLQQNANPSKTAQSISDQSERTPLSQGNSGVVPIKASSHQQRYRAYSIGAGYGTLEKEGQISSIKIAQSPAVLPPVKKREDSNQKRVTKYNDIRAIQFLGAYGNEKIGEVKITIDELKEFLERLGDLESYDGRIMFKHFMEHFKEWIKRMTKVTIELKEKLFLRDFNEKNDFLEIVEECNRYFEDLGEVMESARCVQERYSQNQSLGKIIFQLQRKKEGFKELMESCKVLTTVQQKLEEAIQQGIDSDKIEQIISLANEQFGVYDSGISRHIQKMQKEFQDYKECLKQCKERKETLKEQLNIQELTLISSKLQGVVQNSIFLPIKAREELDNQLSSINNIVQTILEQSKDESIKEVNNIAQKLMQELHLNIPLKKFEDINRNISQSLERLTKQICMKEENDNIQKATEIISNFSGHFIQFSKLFQEEAGLNKGEFNIENNQQRKTIQKAHEICIIICQCQKQAIQLMELFLKKIYSNSNQIEINENCRDIQTFLETDTNCNTEQISTSNGGEDSELMKKYFQQIGYNKADTIKESEPSSVPQICMQSIQRGYNSSCKQKRKEAKTTLKEQKRVLGLLLEECLQYEREEKEEDRKGGPFMKLKSMQMQDNQNISDERSDLQRRIESDKRFLEGWLQRNQVNEDEKDLRVKIVEVLNNYIKKVKFYEVDQSLVNCVQEILPILQADRDKSELIASLLKKLGENKQIVTQIGIEKINFFSSAVASVAVEKALSIQNLILVEESLAHMITKVIEGLNYSNISHLEFILKRDIQLSNLLLPFIEEKRQKILMVSPILIKNQLLLEKVQAYNNLLCESNQLIPNFDDMLHYITQMHQVVYGNQKDQIGKVLESVSLNLTPIFVNGKKNLNSNNENMNLIDSKVKQIFLRKIDKILESLQLQNGSQISHITSSSTIQSVVQSNSSSQKQILQIIRRVGEYLLIKNENVILLKDQKSRIVFICKHNQRDFTHPIDRISKDKSSQIHSDKNYPEIYKKIILNNVYFDSITHNSILYKKAFNSLMYDPRQQQNEGVQVLGGQQGKLYIEGFGVSSKFFDIIGRYCSIKFTVYDTLGNGNSLWSMNITKDSPGLIEVLLQSQETSKLIWISIECEAHKSTIFKFPIQFFSFMDSLAVFPHNHFRQQIIPHLQNQKNTQLLIKSIQSLIKAEPLTEEKHIKTEFDDKAQINQSTHKQLLQKPLYGEESTNRSLSHRQINSSAHFFTPHQETVFAYRSNLNSIEEESYQAPQVSPSKIKALSSTSSHQDNKSKNGSESRNVNKLSKYEPNQYKQQISSRSDSRQSSQGGIDFKQNLETNKQIESSKLRYSSLNEDQQRDQNPEEISKDKEKVGQQFQKKDEGHHQKQEESIAQQNIEIKSNKKSDTPFPQNNSSIFDGDQTLQFQISLQKYEQQTDNSCNNSQTDFFVNPFQPQLQKEPQKKCSAHLLPLQSNKEKKSFKLIVEELKNVKFEL